MHSSSTLYWSNIHPNYIEAISIALSPLIHTVRTCVRTRQSILHDWSDEHALKILKNCYAALPSQGGKVIIMEQLMPVETPLEGTDGIGPACKAPMRTDMLMLVHCEGGRERSAIEYNGLAKQAGFRSFRVVCKIRDSMYSIMEAHKWFIGLQILHVGTIGNMITNRSWKRNKVVHGREWAHRVNRPLAAVEFEN